MKDRKDPQITLKRENIPLSYYWLFESEDPNEVSQSDIDNMAIDWSKYALSVRFVEAGVKDEEIKDEADRFKSIARQIVGYPENACSAVFHYWGSLMSEKVRESFFIKDVREELGKEDREIALELVKIEHNLYR